MELNRRLSFSRVKKKKPSAARDLAESCVSMCVALKQEGFFCMVLHYLPFFYMAASNCGKWEEALVVRGRCCVREIVFNGGQKAAH